MSTEWLKKNLPKEFTKCKYERGTFAKESKGIIQSVSLEKSDIIYDAEKWILLFTISLKNDYTTEKMKQTSLILNEFMLSDRVPRLNGAVGLDNYNHWDLDDLDSVGEALHEIVLPWLDWFTEINNIIEYLHALEKLENLKPDDPAIIKFGQVLTERMYVHPPRTRKYFNGALATLFKRLGKYDLALEHLLKHRDFEIADGGGTDYEPFVKVHLEKMAVIDQGILELEAMKQLHGFIG